MNIHFFNKRYSSLFLCFAAIPVFLLSSLSIDRHVYAQSIGQTKKESGLYKKQLSPRMFLIAVIDSHDDSIGKRCETDLDDIKYAFEDYADWIDADMIEPKIIEGDRFGKAAVNDAVTNWLPSQHLRNTDIVVFYYSGHGFRYPQDVSDYPRMWLKTGNDKNIENNNLRMKEDIYDRIVKMGAGLNLVLSDCCNTTVAGDNADFDNVTVPNRKHETHKRQHPGNEDESDDDMDNGDKLFTPDRPLSILATAAGKGELAGGTEDAGGFFTYYFLDALDACIYDEKLQPDWKAIFGYADEKAGYWARSAACPAAKHNEQGRCVQTVTFKTDASD